MTQDEDEDEPPFCWGCHCLFDADGLVTFACANHRCDSSTQLRVRRMMDEEIDSNLVTLFGDYRIGRKEGQVFGRFPIARRQ